MAGGIRVKVLAVARMLRADDEVVLEATGNTMANVKLLKPYVGRVVITKSIVGPGVRGSEG